MAGLSLLMGLKALILLTFFVYLRSCGMILLSLPFLHASLVALLVSIASHPFTNLPLLLGKSSDGNFPLWAKILFGPFLVFIRIFVFLRRLKMREPVYSEIYEGLYVGGWPSSEEYLPSGDPAVVDCTCELPRMPFIPKSNYLCIATWDTRAPQPFGIESAVRWICRKRAQKKPVYIHCAYGHGRSVCVLCAVLVAIGIVEDWKSAEKMIREKRPCIQMNSFHRKSLEEWSKCRLSPKSSDVKLSSVLGSI